MPSPQKDERITKSFCIKDSLLKEAIKASSEDDMSFSKWVCMVIRKELAARFIARNDGRLPK